MKINIFSLFLLLAALPVSGQESETGYNFLRLAVSARIGALGGENITLIENDASLMFSNPALLSSVSGKTVGLNYMNYMAGVNSASASYSVALSDKATVAAGAQYIGYGSIKETDADNNVTGEFSPKDIALNVYFSYMLSERIAGGIAAKCINSYIGDYHSLGMCVDLGLNYFDPEREWSVSLAARNLGGQLSAYDDEYERLPFDLQAGVSKRLVGAPFRISATLVDLTHWDYKFINHLVAGVDVFLSQQIWLGAGYNFRRANEMTILSGDEESSHGAGLCLGGGIDLERFSLSASYGKYHVSSTSLLLNLSFRL